MRYHPILVSACAISTLVALSLSLTSCVPVLVAGAGVATVTNAAKEKGISGSVGDTQISTAVQAKIYQKDQVLHSRVGVSVQNGEVLLTGSLPSQELIDEVIQLAWSVAGVKNVLSHLSVNTDDSLHLKQGTQDSWITTQVKSALVFTADIKSINYSIKTVNGIVYVTGTAQNKAELDKVLEKARNVSGVKKVINYAQIKESTKAGFTSEEDDTPGEPVKIEKETVEGDAVQEKPKGIKNTPTSEDEPAAEEPAAEE